MAGKTHFSQEGRLVSFGWQETKTSQNFIHCLIEDSFECGQRIMGSTHQKHRAKAVEERNERLWLLSKTKKKNIFS